MTVIREHKCMSYMGLIREFLNYHTFLCAIFFFLKYVSQNTSLAKEIEFNMFY